MKTKLLTAAIAAASVMASSGVIAEGSSGSDTLKTALGNATVGFETFGGYMDTTWDNIAGSDFDESDFDFDRARLSLGGTLKENVTYGFEVEWLLHDSDLAGTQDSSGIGNTDENDLRVNDLYLERAFGATVVTLGRYKQLADRQNYIELSDRVFTNYSTNVYGPISNVLDDIASDIGLISPSASNLAGNLLGADRRVDGLGVRSSIDAGLHGSFNVYKGGVNVESDELSRNFGYAGSIGWLGGSDNLTFGVTFSAYQEDGAEDEATDAELEDSGYSAEAILATGPLSAGLTYGDSSVEFKDNTDDLELETDAIGAWGVFNLSNAMRSFNEYGVLQGPSVSPGEYGYEIGLRYSTGELNLDENGTSASADQEVWGLAFNFYCGSFTKWYFEYSAAEYGDSSEVEVDSFSLGGRIDF